MRYASTRRARLPENGRSPYRRWSPARTKHRLRLEYLEERQLLAIDTVIPGALIEQQQLATAVISPANDVDTYALDLDGGQTVTLIAAASGGLAPMISLTDPGNTILATASAAANQTAVLQTAATTLAGTYTFSVTGAAASTGDYTLALVLNAAAEDELNGGAGNDVPGTAQTIEGSFISLVAADTDRGAAVGQIPFQDDVDYYSFTLDDDATTTLALRGDDDGLQLKLWDATGTTLLAGGVEAANVDQIIEDFRDQTMDGIPTTYLASVGQGTAATGTSYSLLVTRGTGFEVEPNLDFDDADPVAGSVLGNVTASTFSGSNLLTDFAGMDSFSTNCGCEPPDTHGAVGPDHFVEVINTAIAIYHKDGTEAVPPRELRSFFDASLVAGESFDYDPVMVYDEMAERWAVAVLIGANAGAAETDLLYAVSDTSDPTQGFTEQHRIDFSGISPGLFADYPKIGWNADAHVLSFNMFDFSFEDVNIVTFDKASLLDANRATVDFTITERTAGDFTMAAATMHESLPGDPMWFVQESDAANRIRVTRMENVLAANPTYTNFEIPVASFGFPPDAAQPGGSFNTNDARILNAEYRDGRLVATHAVGVGGRALARWYEFDVSSGTPSLTQQGNVDPGPGIHTYFPSIAINERGDLGITYMQSSGSEFVSMYAAGQPFGSDPGSLSSPVLVKAGNETYNGGRGGDYSGITVDPVTDTFWAVNEISLAGDPNPLWSTWIGEFEVAPLADNDWFEIPAIGNDVVSLRTFTPLDGPGELINELDPLIELYAPDGTLLASDDNGAGDGRNAAIANFLAPVSGAYRVAVTGAGDTNGAYVLEVSGSTAANTAPSVVSSQPVDGLLVGVFPTYVTLDFSESILASTVAASDLLIGGRPATSVTQIDGDTWEFAVDPLANLGDGTYAIRLGAGSISDLAGGGNLAFESTFLLDTTGPRILNTFWNEGPLPADATINPGTLTFSAQFDEGLFSLASARRGLRTPGTDDIVLTEVLSGQSFVPVSISYDPNAAIFEATYAGLPEGNYTLRLVSGDGAFEDQVGNDLDGEPNDTAVDGAPTGNEVPGGDYTVSFAVDIVTPVDTEPFVRRQPLGSLVAASNGSAGALSSAADTDLFTFNADFDETVSALLVPSHSAATLSVSYGTTTVVAPAAGEPVVLSPIPVAAAGAQTLTIGGDQESGYTLDVYLNATVDALVESPLATPLEPSLLTIAADRYAAVGSASGSLGGTEFRQTSNPAAFVDIAGTGTPLGLGDDGEANIVTSVGNSIFSAGTVTVANNGVIVAGGGADVDYENSSLPTTGFGNALAPFWDDIDTGPGNVYWDERLVNGINTLIVQWDDRPHFDSVGNATFQVQVFESGPVAARFAYEDVVFGSSAYDFGASATIGYQLNSGDGQQFSFNSPVISNGDVVDISLTTPNLDVDEFALDLTGREGTTLDITLAGSGAASFGGQLLELVGPTGVVATASTTPLGAPSPSFDQAILGYPVTTGGTYAVRLSTDISGDYSLLVTANRVLDTEPNNNAGQDPLRGLGSGVGAIGSLSGGQLQFLPYNNPSLFVDISATGTPLNLSDDAEANVVTTVGNSLIAAGPVTIANNGVLVAGAGANVSATNSSLPTSSFDTALLPFWDDIDSETGNVYWEEQLVNGINTLIVQWDDRPHYSNTGMGTFQLQLFESGSVAARFVYPDVVFGGSGFDNGGTATVGYQRDVGDASQFSFNAPVISNGDVIDLLLTDLDLYELALDAGDEVRLVTSTPFDDPARAPRNDLDPSLAVIHPDGLTVVAADSNSAGDGRNAVVNFVAPTTGIYTVRITSDGGAGEYVLDVQEGFVAGDFDGDGDLDCDDIDTLSREIASGANNLVFDLTGDGLVDGNDLSEWVLNIKGTLFGDANLDFSVDTSDFNLWNSNKFTTNTAWCTGDFNADGNSDTSDFNIWNGNKFTSADRVLDDGAGEFAVPAPLGVPANTSFLAGGIGESSRKPQPGQQTPMLKAAAADLRRAVDAVFASAGRIRTMGDLDHTAAHRQAAPHLEELVAELAGRPQPWG